MNTATGRTSGKKRANHGSDTDRSKRETANMIERRRMQNINCGFSSLKKLLPPSNRKQTKAAILQQASQHILRLQRAIIQFKAENDSLRNVLGVKNATCTNSCVPPYSSQSISQCASKPCEHDSCYKQRNAIIEYDCKPTMLKQMLHNTGGDGRLMEYSASLAREQSNAAEYDNELYLSKKMEYDDSLAHKRPTTALDHDQESYLSRNRLLEASSCSLVKYDPLLAKKRSTAAFEHGQDPSLSKKRLLEPTSSSLDGYSPPLTKRRNTAGLEYECEPTLASKALHQTLCMPRMDRGWKMFEHVKKFKPSSPKTSGFQTDSNLPTPPVSPEMTNHGDYIFNRSKTPAFTSSRFSLTSCPPICHQSSEGFGRIQPWKMDIFNSKLQGSSSPEQARGDRSKSVLKDCSNMVGVREEREVETKGGYKKINSGKENYQGDLQSIIDAIQIIEKNV